jgi:hypothetical protein
MRAGRRPISIAVMAAVASLGTVLFLPTIANATGPDTWTGAASSYWGVAANWSLGVPASGANVIFPAGIPATTVNINVSGVVVQNMTIDNTYTFATTCNCSLGVNGTSTIAVATNDSANFDLTVNFASATSVTASIGMDADISLTMVTGSTGAFNLIDPTGGILAMSGVNTYTATATTLESGRLYLFGTLGSGPVIIDSGAEMESYGGTTISNALTLYGNGAFTRGLLNDYTSSILNLTGVITLGADSEVNGNLQFQNTVNVGAHTLTATVANAGPAGLMSFKNAVNGSGAVAFNAAGTLTFSGAGSTIANVVLTSGGGQIVSVTSSMASTTFSGAGGGILEGTGTIGTVAGGTPLTILGGSTLNNNAAGGVLTIASQPLLGPSAALQVEDASPSTYGSVAVIGALNLNGATLLQPIDGISARGNVFTILTSTGPLSGTFAGDPDGTVITDNRGASFAIHYLANSVTLTNVTPLSTSFTAAATPSTVPFGSSSTLSESGLPGAATGTVTMASGGSTLCVIALPGTTCSTSSNLTGGTYPITATYSGDGTYATSTATTTLTVSTAPTSFTASASPSSVPFGSTSTLVASGLPVNSTGTVTFASGGSTLCVAALPGTSCTTSATLAGGTYPITATYSGDADDASSTATTALTVTPASTSFTASATPSSVSFGTSATLAATGLPGGATGTVTFASGGSPLCTASLPTTTCSTSTSLAAAIYPITATYSGDASYAGSTATTTVTVTAVGTSFTASATPASVSVGTSATLADSGLPGAGTGTVTFTSGLLTLCTAPLPATTSCTTSTTLAAGTYPVTATYTGDTNYMGSTATTSLTVTPAATSFTAAATPGTVTYGTTTSLSASGLPVGATGAVTFASGGSILCTATLPATSCSTASSLDTGTYPIAATYSGDGNYTSSTASTSLTVTQALTSITASATPSSVPFGTSATLAANGLPGTATGTVTFVSSGSTLCVATLPSASCVPSTFLAVGNHAIIATYSGDGNEAGSTASTTLTVTLAATSTTVTSSLNPAVLGQTIVYTARVTSNPGSGTVSFTDNGLAIAGCTGVSLNPLTGGAACSTTSTTTGVDTIGATYSGNADFASSSAPTSGVLALAETVDAAVTVPTTGAASGSSLGQGIVGSALALLGCLGVVRARRRRLLAS